MAKKRNEYKEELKWNLKDIFKTDKDYEEAYQKLVKELANYKNYQGHILDSANSLLEFLEFDTNLNQELERIYSYAHLNNDSDTADTKYQEMFGKAYNLYQKYSETTSFVVPEVLANDYSKIEKYITEEPKLKAYERMLKEIFKFKKYTLSKEEEKILSSMSSMFNAPDDIYSYLTDADIKFKSIKDEHGNIQELDEKSYRKYIESENREIRKQAFENLLSGYGDFKNTYASLLSSEIKKNNKIAEVRGYRSALEASLYGNDIPTSIYDNLIKTVKKNVAPLSHFWALKRTALGLDELHIYDSYAPITKESTKEYTVEEAHDLLMKSLSVLGDTYIKDLENAFKNRWIDFCPNANKRNGAYCSACYSVHPYVLLSYDGSLNNVSTLAHELGHAMHYYYAIKNQTYQDYGYSIFVAEVASQVNQIILSKYLIANTSDIDEKKYLIADLISDFKSTIYRQTMFADFERQAHELEQKGEILTHEVLSNLYYKLNKEYQGENIAIDDVIKYEWERIPHFYMNFYVYQYATAYAAAIKIAMDILNEKEEALASYLEFLKLGCTKTPIDSLKIANVDMTKPKTLEEAFTYFEELVNSLEELYKEGE